MPEPDRSDDLPGAFPGFSTAVDDDVQRSFVTDLNSLSLAVRARRAEYVRPQHLRLRIGTWNVASLPDTEAELAFWFKVGTSTAAAESRSRRGSASSSSSKLPREGTTDDGRVHQSTGGGLVDLYVLGLQEIVDVNSPTEALRPYVDSGPANKWKDAVRQMLPDYELLSEQQLVGMLLLVYASPIAAPLVSSVSSCPVGTGFLGYLGNKGAVSTRIVVGGATNIVFLNCHLSAGSEEGSLERRNWDVDQIVQRTRFDYVSEEDEITDTGNNVLGHEDFVFWFGDLNYRIDGIPGNDIRQLLHLHTRNEYRVSRPIAAQFTASDPTEDPESLETTLASLLPHDQLLQQQRRKRAFHDGWREGNINFLPTYKYDVGKTAVFDSSEKKRAPSWCDRIIYRTRPDRQAYEQATREAQDARRRDEEMRALGLDKEAESEDVLFEYDPEADNEDAQEEPPEAQEDALQLLSYTAHQNVISSDHKPLSADFVLKIDVVDYSRKAMIHQEVARQLDRAENEARPDVTVVVDQPAPGAAAGAVHFGAVYYDVPVARTLTIANTSSVPATFSFRSRPGPDGDRVTPPWLHICLKPKSSPGSSQNLATTLHPGETTDIQLVLHVHSFSFVRALNLRNYQLDEVLVLNVQDGRDHFVLVSGDWMPSSFCWSLDELTRFPEAGVRHAPIPLQSYSSSPRSSIPRELLMLTEAVGDLTERVIAEWDMTGPKPDEAAPWHDPAWPFAADTWTFRDHRQRRLLLSRVREALDTRAPLTAAFPINLSSVYRVELLAETLLDFLSSLHRGMIPAEQAAVLDARVQANERAKVPLSPTDSQSMVLDILAIEPVCSISLTFVMYLLNRLINELAPVPHIPAPADAPRSASSSTSASALANVRATDIGGQNENYNSNGNGNSNSNKNGDDSTSTSAIGSIGNLARSSGLFSSRPRKLSINPPTINLPFRLGGAGGGDNRPHGPSSPESIDPMSILSPASTISSSDDTPGAEARRTPPTSVPESVVESASEESEQRQQQSSSSAASSITSAVDSRSISTPSTSINTPASTATRHRPPSLYPPPPLHPSRQPSPTPSAATSAISKTASSSSTAIASVTAARKRREAVSRSLCETFVAVLFEPEVAEPPERERGERGRRRRAWEGRRRVVIGWFLG